VPEATKLKAMAVQLTSAQQTKTLLCFMVAAVVLEL